MTARKSDLQGVIWDWIRAKAKEIADFEHRELAIPDVPRDQAVMQWILQDLGNCMDEHTETVFRMIADRREARKREAA